MLDFNYSDQCGHSWYHSSPALVRHPNTVFLTLAAENAVAQVRDYKMFRYVIFKITPEYHNASDMKLLIDVNYIGPRRWDFDKFRSLLTPVENQSRYILYDFPVDPNGPGSGLGTTLLLILYVPETCPQRNLYDHFLKPLQQAIPARCLIVQDLADMREDFFRETLSQILDFA